MSFSTIAFAFKKATVLRDSASAERDFHRDESLPYAELNELQNQRAIDHARFAFEHTAFYREFYRSAGFTSADLRDPAAFIELPVVDKTMVRERNSEFISDEANASTSATSTTGGSTGEPLKLLRDVRFQARALEWRLFRWWGIEPQANIATITRHVKSRGQSRRHAIQWWPSRRFQLDAFDMNRSSVQHFLKQWDRIKPDLMIGYVGAVAEVARIIETECMQISPPKAIAVTAAPLTPAQRDLIQSVFRAPVYDHYRSAEVPWIAGECLEQSGLHVFNDVRKLELLDSDGKPAPDETIGDVVVSDLTNRVFPLIRYRLGDRTAYMSEKCSCGVTFPRIRPVSGRTSDVLHLPNGQSVAGEGLAQIFSSTPDAVRQFQIRQAADYSITIKCVMGSSPDATRDIQSALIRFREIVHDSVSVQLDLVDSIPHDGGKTRYLVSEVSRA